MPLPTIPSGNVASALGGEYEVANSCRFNSADSAYMHKTLGTATNEKKFTFSAWVKRGSLAGDQTIFNVGPDSSDEWQTGIRFRAPSDYDLHCTFDDRGTATQLITSPEYKDPAAWMHVVFAVDTTQSTAANRMKLYVNGVQQNDDNTYVNVYPSQDTDCDAMDSGNTIAVGRRTSSTNMYFDGYMAEVCFVDGTAYAASDFGEFDEDSPTIWKPKDVSGLTFGNNGFYLDFEDSSNLGNDANGGTDLTESGLAAADQSVDTPTNNACTLNPLAVATSSALAFSEGNNKIYNSASSWRPAYGTFPVSEGKWYFEVKGLLFPGTSYIQIGWVSLEYTGGGNSALTDEVAGWGNTAPAAVYDSRSGNVYWQNASTNGNSSYGDSYAAGDVIGVALDLDNSKIYFAEDNTWKNSGDPTSGSTGTGAFSIVSGYTWVPFIGLNNATAEATFASPVQANTSDATDGNSRGQFEFAPPSGYLSLCSLNTA